MRYQLPDGQVIIADQAFIDQHHPDATLLPEQQAVERKTILTHREFLKRLTPAEFKGIRQTAKNNADIDMWMYLFEQSQEVDLTDADTIAGIYALESAGLIGVGRAAEILS